MQTQSIQTSQIRHRRFRLARPTGLLALLANISALAAPTPDSLQLHVPSPDWRDQIIYFVMLDRFADGNPANNDQGANEYDPGNTAKYSGGDLSGVQQRLDYIKGLGATTVWITPPVANQWWDGSRQFGGYHGYWAEHFKKVDAHYGTLDDYRRLSDALHRRGMYLVQDVVVNHTGNFFEMSGNSGKRNARSVPVPAPTQSPFDWNDPANPEHRAANIYHWTPEIADFTDHTQETTYQLAGLDDLNTEHPLVRSALRDSYNYWIREVGVDGFRIDTAFHVPADYFRDFLYADDPQQPGVLHTAKQTGRNQFHVFGEGFGVAPAYSDAQAKKIDSYMRAADGTTLLPAMINFPLYGSITDVFARGRPTAELGHRIRSTMQIHQQPYLMPSFIDNHDVDRFLAGGSEAGMKQALLLIMTLPGIPTLYYGTEQGFREQRPAMFAGGYGSNGRDHFNTAAPLYRFIQQLTALRRAHPVLSRGTPTILAENAASAGALAYRMSDGKDSLLIVFNTASHETLLDNLATGLPANTVLEGLYAIAGSAPEHVVDAGGTLHLKLPAHSAYVWKISARQTARTHTTASLQIDALPQQALQGDVNISGRAEGIDQFQLVVDGDLSGAQTITPDASGRWQAQLRTDSMIEPTLTHRVVAWSSSHQVASAGHSFRVERQWQVLNRIDDPAGDDHGPRGRYRYPADASWKNVHPLDIRQVQVAASGGALQLRVQLRDLLASWNPPNGFDHLALTAFIQLANTAGGSTVMPQQNSALPNGMRWHYRLRVNGWSNALFAADNANASNEGTGTNLSALLHVERDRKTISLTLPAKALGNLASLSGSKIYLTSWDYDGGYKPLTANGSGHGFSGGDGAKDPLIMDDTVVITLP